MGQNGVKADGFFAGHFAMPTLWLRARVGILNIVPSIENFHVWKFSRIVDTKTVIAQPSQNGLGRNIEEFRHLRACQPFLLSPRQPGRTGKIALSPELLPGTAERLVPVLARGRADALPPMVCDLLGQRYVEEGQACRPGPPVGYLPLHQPSLVRWLNHRAPVLPMVSCIGTWCLAHQGSPVGVLVLVTTGATGNR